MAFLLPKPDEQSSTDRKVTKTSLVPLIPAGLLLI